MRKKQHKKINPNNTEYDRLTLEPLNFMNLILFQVLCDQLSGGRQGMAGDNGRGRGSLQTRRVRDHHQHNTNTTTVYLSIIIIQDVVGTGLDSRR